MRGFIYALVNSSLPGLVKVGRTTRLPSERVGELSASTGVPTPFIVAFEQGFEDCVAAEAFIHAALEQKGLRQAPNREFFRAPVADIIRIIMSVPGRSSDGAIIQSGTLEQQDGPWSALMEEANNCANGTNGYLQDHAEAYRLYKDAARLGCAKAYERLGYHLSHGLGVAEDKAKAIEQLRKAVANGYYYAYLELMSIYCALGHEQNFHMCIEKLILARAARTGDEHEVAAHAYPSALRFYIALALIRGWIPKVLDEIKSNAPLIREYSRQPGQEALRESNERVANWLWSRGL